MGGVQVFPVNDYSFLNLQIKQWRKQSIKDLIDFPDKFWVVNIYEEHITLLWRGIGFHVPCYHFEH